MRDIRCQGVLLKGNELLVARQFNFKRNEEFWLLPGGGKNEDEDNEEAILREFKEETNLDIEIKGVLFDEIDNSGKFGYRRYITYLCIAKEQSLLEIGKETQSHKRILDLVWCSLIDEKSWNKYILNEQFYPSMKNIKDKLIKLNIL